jgi:hypothetical protein
MTLTHDPDGRRDVAHVGPVELYTPVLARSRDFFVDVMGLREILRAADVCVHIETGPHKHAIQQTFFLYVWEPGGNRIEICNAGARLILAPDSPVVDLETAQ